MRASIGFRLYITIIKECGECHFWHFGHLFYYGTLAIFSYYGTFMKCLGDTQKAVNALHRLSIIPKSP